MAYTQSDLDDLREAYAQGVLVVRFADGRTTTFASGDDLRRRIHDVQAELSAQTGKRAPRIVRVTHGKGL